MKNLKGMHWFAIGANIVTTFTVSILIGLYLDKKLNSSPKMVLIFLGLGILSMFLLFYRLYKGFSKVK